MLKKLIILFSWLLVTSLVLAACGADEEDETPTPAEEAAPSEEEEAVSAVDCFMTVEDDATIVFSGWGDETEQQIYRDSIDRFAEACPAVTVDYQPIPADFQTKLKASMAGGTLTSGESRSGALKSSVS